MITESDLLSQPSSALEVGSPGYWLDRLEKELVARRTGLSVFGDYYDGDHKLTFATDKFRAAFGRQFDAFADNWCDLVVDAVEERLNVQGFRIGGASAGDDIAWQIWQRNKMDAQSQLAHTEALIYGVAYGLVWPGDGGPTITIESPLQMICAKQAGSRSARAAALKVWRDDDGYDNATLYLPDALYKYRTRGKGSDGTAGASRWEPRRVGDEEWPLRNRLGVVPVVPLENRPRLLTAGTSEIRKVIPVQDAVNKLAADLLVAAEFAAMRQRWATGMEIPTDPQTNEPVEPFGQAVKRLWMSEDPETKFGEFGEATLTNFVSAIDMFVQHIASQTRTPPHYFFLKGELPSGESIKSAETGLVAKARRKMRFFGEGWEEIVALALQAAGDDRVEDAAAMETIWADPESRTESEHVDALVKKQALGVPNEQLQEDAGYSPQQIARFKAMRRAEALEQAAAAADFGTMFNTDVAPQSGAGEAG